jgi:hypothetical protein
MHAVYPSGQPAVRPSRVLFDEPELKTLDERLKEQEEEPGEGAAAPRTLLADAKALRRRCPS